MQTHGTRQSAWPGFATLLTMVALGSTAAVGASSIPAGAPSWWGAPGPGGAKAIPDSVARVLEGEGALRVAMDEDTLEVRWITGDSVEGRLEVWAGRSLVASAATRAGHAHGARLPAPGADRFMIRYGAAAGPLHETEVDLALLAPSPVEVGGVDSLFLVGDTHGELDTLRAVLRNARVIDEEGRWAAGRAHLAFLGDLVDRGPDVTRLLWFVYRLEREARAAGGAVHVLLGNHEVMVLLDDVRYVHPRELWISRAYGVPYARMFDPERTVLGRWLAAKPAMMKIDGALLAHGGVSEHYLDYSLSAHRDSLAAFMDEELFRKWSDTTVVVVVDSALVEPALQLPHVTGAIVMDSVAYDRRIEFFWDEDSVFWHRGYVQSDMLAEELERVLDHFGAEVHAVAHTPDSLGAHERYGGALIATHAPTPAAQLVLLAKGPDGDRARYRFGPAGPPEPLPAHNPSGS